MSTLNKKFYVAACVFTEEYPALSKKICDYLREKFSMPIIRCCVDKYKVAEFEQRMPENYRDEWRAIKHFEKFPAGSTLVSICHNCSAIFEERHPEFFRESIWEFILADKNFPYPNHHGEEITIQDCWRSKENSAEQEAARELLRRMNFKIVELEENHGRKNFAACLCINRNRRAIRNLPRKDFCTARKVCFKSTRPNKKNRSCWSTAQRFGRKKLRRIAIIAFAV